MTIPAALTPKPRVLLGPGPSDVPHSILQALALPTIGHLDPAFLAVMDDIRAMLRDVFKTGNPTTVPTSGTGSSGMETCMVNLLEPGDRVLVGINGVFGTRMAEVARRCSASVTAVEGAWGRALDLNDFKKAAGASRFKLVCVVHAETSTGALQNLDGFSGFAHDRGALLMVDAVTSLGGVPFEMDAWGIDAVYSGTQKCLACPPGLSPVSLSENAVTTLQVRNAPVQSWYLDLSLIGQYWGTERVYHHTAPINMLFALHEALRLILEEGLDVRHRRHRTNAEALWAGLTAMGLTLPVPDAERLPPLTVVQVPDGIDEAAVRAQLLKEYNLEIGGGLGPMQGKVWRIGLMGHGSNRKNVTLCLAALTAALRAQGHTAKDDPLAAANAVWA